MLIDFIKGLAVTFKHIWKKPVTFNYPEVKRPQPAYYRGRHRLQRYENGLERCVACCLCSAVCPPEAIYIEPEENDPQHPIGAGERYARIYQINQIRCIWCGFCEEACPEDAVVMGPIFEMANYKRSDFVCNKEQMLDAPDKGFGKPIELRVNQPL